MNQRSYLYFAFKIKDGLFIGDFNSIQERDFLLQNKILYIVNCAAGQLLSPNFNIPIKFLNFHWLDSDEQIILDQEDQNITQVANFLDEANENGDSTLICSLRGQSRSLTIMTAYLMKKFSWSLYKALEYMNSKRQDFEIRASFLKQLLDFDQRIAAIIGNQQSKAWTDIPNDSDAIIIQNTFLNSQSCIYKAQQCKKIEQRELQTRSTTKIKWDQNLTTIIEDTKQELVSISFDKTPNRSILKSQNNQKELKDTRENFHKGTGSAKKIFTSLESQEKERVQKLRKTPVPDYRAYIQESIKRSKEQSLRPISPHISNKQPIQSKTQTTLNDTKQTRLQTEQNDQLKQQQPNQIQFNINLNINQLHLVGMTNNQNHINRRCKVTNQQKIVNKTQQESFIRKSGTRENSPDIEELQSQKNNFMIQNNKIIKSTVNSPEKESAKINNIVYNQPRSQSDQIRKEQFEEAIKYYETRKNLQQTVQKYLPQLPTKSALNSKFKVNASDNLDQRNQLNKEFLIQKNNYLKQNFQQQKQMLIRGQPRAISQKQQVRPEKLQRSFDNF